jgi:glycosyltransferase involved in cell wall biosynthesis
MFKVKNVRPGILIIADAGLRLEPGRVLEVEELTPHMERAVSAGLLVKWMADNGHEVHAIAPKRKGAAGGDTVFDGGHARIATERFAVPVDYVSPDLPPPPGYWETERREVRARLERQFRTWSPDLVFVGRETYAGHAILPAKSRGLPVILRISGAQTWAVSRGDYPEDFRREFCEAFQAADLVCPQAGHMAGILRELSVRRVRLISNMVALSRFQPQPPDRALRVRFGIPANDSVAVHLSNMKKVKRLPDIPESAAIALKRNRRITYLIVGNGPYQAKAKQICARRGIESNFRFVEWVDYNEVPAVISLADVVLMPSEMEHQARLYLESQACGRVLLASDVDGAREVVTDGETGLLFRMGDVEDLAAKTLFAVSDQELRQRIGRNARIRVQRHDLERIAEQYESAMYEMAGAAETR